MKASDIIRIIESFAPSGIQEDWDNSGLVTGDQEAEVKSILLCLDITEEVMDEAMQLGCNMIISHHPLVFSGMKRFTGKDPVSRMVRRAIREDLLVYSAHTSLDQVKEGISGAIADKLELASREILVPRKDGLIKLSTFIPHDHLENVSKAIFLAGAGNIGNYDSCGFSVKGEGSFRAGDDANPYIGRKGKLHYEAETRFETIFPVHIKAKVVSALLESHPYEEVAYDLCQLKNDNNDLGLGIIGEMPEGLPGREFLELVRKKFHTGIIRYSRLLDKPVKRVAVMGGSGSEFLDNAIRKGADAYVTADVKYHNFFNADGKIMLLDIGHFESEQVALEVLNKILLKKLTNFAVHLSKINTNPINYY